MAAEKGDKVKVEYTGLLSDGSIFDASEKHGKPLEFELGSGMVIKGFDNALTGMEEGEEKEINLASKEAYGDNNPDLVKKIPKDKIPPEAKEGMMLMMGLPNGQQAPVKIIKLDDKEATLDLNHPLAGKDLTFKLKLVGIEKKKEGEVKAEPETKEENK